MRDVRSDTVDRVAIGVASVPMNTDENASLLDNDDAEVQLSDVGSGPALLRVSCTLSCVAGNTSLFIDVMTLEPTTNDVQSRSQAIITIVR